MIVIYILCGLIVLILLRALSLSNESHLEKTISIHKPAEEIFKEVRFVKNHMHFNKWMMADPNLKVDYSGTDGTVGFTSHWKSDIKNVGEGIQKITAIDEGKKVSYHLTFIKPFEGTADSDLTIIFEGPAVSTVSWSFTGPRNFMMKIMQVLLNVEKMLGKDLQTNLDNLKQKMEKH